jgi:catechol 2,3-dioxygenase-like lactoylglutathione lyase family enzyme
MRLDHIAYRTKDRIATARFFQEAFGYKIQQEFPLVFDDGTTARCIALEPPEKKQSDLTPPWKCLYDHFGAMDAHFHTKQEEMSEYHMPPEIFVSDGDEGSIVGEWVKARGGVGGIHHLAYQVEDVEAKMKEWQEKGYAEFASDKPLGCPEDNLIQVFTKPSELTGVIFEFIKRGEHGFCRENVANLMRSTKDFH